MQWASFLGWVIAKISLTTSLGTNTYRSVCMYIVHKRHCTTQWKARLNYLARRVGRRKTRPVVVRTLRLRQIANALFCGSFNSLCSHDHGNLLCWLPVTDLTKPDKTRPTRHYSVNFPKREGGNGEAVNTEYISPSELAGLTNVM